MNTPHADGPDAPARGKSIYHLLAEHSQAWVARELAIDRSVCSRIASGELPCSRSILEAACRRWTGRNGRPLFDARTTILVGTAGQGAVKALMAALRTDASAVDELLKALAA